MFLSDEGLIKDYGMDLKERVKKSCDAYFKTDTPGTRSRYDYYQGKTEGVLENYPYNMIVV